MRPVIVLLLVLSAAPVVAADEPKPVKLPGSDIPVIDWSRVGTPTSALTVERTGNELQSLTFYDTDGKPVVILRTDGKVEVMKGNPDEAAKLFFKIVSDMLLTNCKQPTP